MGWEKKPGYTKVDISFGWRGDSYFSGMEEKSGNEYGQLLEW